MARILERCVLLTFLIHALRLASLGTRHVRNVDVSNKPTLECQWWHVCVYSLPPGGLWGWLMPLNVHRVNLRAAKAWWEFAAPAGFPFISREHVYEMGRCQF